MDITIHPLQSASSKLLLSLYQDFHLPVTPAMQSVLNGHYPTTKEIINTLSYYKDHPEVAEFVKNHEQEISSAKESLNQKVATGIVGQPAENLDDDFFSSKLEFINAFKSLKAVSIESLENAVSEALSKICNEELIVEIDSMQKSENGINFNAEMKLCIRPKQLIR